MDYSAMTTAQLESEYDNLKRNIFFLECNDTVGQGVSDALGALYRQKAFVSNEIQRRAK